MKKILHKIQFNNFCGLDGNPSRFAVLYGARQLLRIHFAA